ncbi:SusF/SusE family outer membrane protein [Geofilum sp. OHC36d9]|uniref:SusF/SusE family outer membrane protein n=1 Tax=Geofilum sp. OHC36d9 TaxID=3458413 RepID=UPI0040338880
MKNSKILLPLLCIPLFWGCEDESKVTMNDEVIAPVLASLDGQDYVISETTDLTDTVAMWSWELADYGFNAAVNYSVEVDTDPLFSSPVELTSSTDSFAVITAAALNSAALNYITSSEELTFVVRLKTTINFIDFESVVEPVYSNVMSYTFTGFYAQPEYPSAMYMIGTDFGNWDWGSDGIADMIPVNGVDGAFWCIRYFNAANGFKWSPVKGWGEDFFELDDSEGYTVADGNAFVPADGLYVVYMDMQLGKITIEQASVYGMGDCFGGWGAGDYPFTIAGDKMTITTTGSGELRMYAGASVATSDWWTREFIILDGKLEYRGTGDDQERVNVNAGSVITLDFNAGTGTIE